MINNFSTHTGLTGSSNTSHTNQRLDNLESQVDGLESGLDSLQTEVEDLSTVVNTETVNASAVNSTVVDTNALSSDSASFDTADIGIINSATIENSGTITTDGLTAETVTANSLSGQLTDAQASIEATNLTAEDLDATNIDATNIVTDSLTTSNLTLETIQADETNTNNLSATTGSIGTLTANEATVTTGEVTTLASEDHTTDRLVVNSTATVHTENVETSNIETANVDVLVNAKHTGTLSLNLDPAMAVANDYYLLKIKKNFNRLNIKVDGSLDITILNAYEAASTTTSTTPMVLSHLYSLDNVVLYSMDDEYIYIEISPKDGTDLIYSYEADTEVEDIITASLNEEVDFDWYYKPEAISEVIFLGTAEHPYQVTILGKLKAAIAPTFDNYEFDDITINKNIYVKDYYDTEGSVWVYKTGTVNDYLSNIEDYVDEQGIQHYRVDWRERVHFRTPEEYIVKTEDETDEHGRVTKANINTLIDLGTLANYNGKVLDVNENETNPITKLGTVDEGNWNKAGYVYSDDVKVVGGGTGLTIEPENITWKMGSDTETFNVWDYAEDNLSWVEV